MDKNRGYKTIYTKEVLKNKLFSSVYFDQEWLYIERLVPNTSYTEKLRYARSGSSMYSFQKLIINKNQTMHLNSDSIN